MSKENFTKIFEEVRFLIENHMRYPDLTKEMNRVFKNNSQDFLNSIKDDIEDCKDRWFQVMSQAIINGNLQAITAISDIYFKNISFFNSGSENNSQSLEISNSILGKKTNDNSSSINKLFSLKDKEGNSLLHIATKLGKIDIIDWLMENGADVNALNKNKENLLLYAFFTCTDESFNFLLSKLYKKIDLNAQDIYGDTILCIAVNKNKTKLVRNLISFGADVNCRNLLGNNALNIAVCHRDIEITEALLQHKADFNCLNSRKLDALGQAATYGNVDAVKTILKHAAKENIRISNISDAIRRAQESLVEKKILEKEEILQSLRERLESYKAEDALLIEPAKSTPKHPSSPKIISRG